MRILKVILEEAKEFLFAFIGLGIFAVLFGAMLWVFSQITSSDPIFTDQETGCEYIRTQHGITPRLDSNGHPICRVPVAH